METYYKSPKIEQLHLYPTLQDGKYFQLERYPQKRRLACQDRLKDAYLTVPMAKACQKYLRFQWRGKIYEFKSLPFGLATAPITFTKLFRPVVAYLRQQGVHLVVYLDNILLMADTGLTSTTS